MGTLYYSYIRIAWGNVSKYSDFYIIEFDRSSSDEIKHGTLHVALCSIEQVRFRGSLWGLRASLWEKLSRA